MGKRIDINWASTRQAPQEPQKERKRIAKRIAMRQPCRVLMLARPSHLRRWVDRQMRQIGARASAHRQRSLTCEVNRLGVRSQEGRQSVSWLLTWAVCPKRWIDR